MFKTILVPTDGTPLSEKAISAAIEFAQKNPESKIIGVSVVEKLPFTPHGTKGSDLTDYVLQIQEMTKQRVAKIAESAQAAGVPCETVIEESANPHEGILRAAAKYNCDCIFMASHGRKGFSKFFIGSETQRVLAGTHIPVLVYR
jgi:nucleotide-binding universal stress UspA family protein